MYQKLQQFLKALANNMSSKFSIIVCDPPWNFSDALSMSKVKRGAKANYDTMSMLEIEQLPIKNISDPDGALLALWVPSSLLPRGLRIMEAWGFNFKQTYIWNKTKNLPFKELSKLFFKEIKLQIKSGPVPGCKPWDHFDSGEIKNIFQEIISEFSLIETLGFGMGRLTRACHEICLIGINNNKIYKQLQNKSQRSVCFAPNLKHSAKPEALQDSLELMFPNALKKGKCLEIFGRRSRPGWMVLGNQSQETMGEDITTSLLRLV